MKKKPLKKPSKKVSPPMKGATSIKKQNALKVKTNAQARRNTLKKKINSLLELPSDKKIKSYYFVKKGNKKIKLTTTNTVNFFINNLLNQATKESGVINKVKNKYGRKLKPAKPISLKKQLKLNFNAWQRKDIIAKITEFKIKKTINTTTGEEHDTKKDLANFIMALNSELTNIDSGQSLSLYIDFKNRIATYGLDMAIDDHEDLEDFN